MEHGIGVIKLILRFEVLEFFPAIFFSPFIRYFADGRQNLKNFPSFVVSRWSFGFSGSGIKVTATLISCNINIRRRFPIIILGQMEFVASTKIPTMKLDIFLIAPVTVLRCSSYFSVDSSVICLRFCYFLLTRKLFFP